MVFLGMDQSGEHEQLKVSGFNHFGGKHCETNAFRKVLAHNGFSLSEEMLFGLGGGIGFIYWHSKKMPTPFVGGRNGAFPGFLSNVAHRLKINLEVIQTNSEKKGYEALKSILRKGEPALVYGDIAYLPYFMVTRHFGGHAFVVFELDEKKGEVMVSDRGSNPCTLKLQDLKKARSSSFSPFSPKNSMLKLSYPNEMPHLNQSIYSALRDCCQAMLYPPISNFGIDGIKKWAKLIMKWPETFKGQSLFECLKDTFVNIELAGTGGSAFRLMYVQFLEESVKKYTELVGVAHGLLPELKAMYVGVGPKPKVQFFEGLEGIKTAYEDTLTAQETIRAYASIENMHKALPGYFPEYYQRRSKKKIKIRAIFPDTPEARERITHNKDEGREALLVSSDKYAFSPEIVDFLITNGASSDCEPSA